MHGLQKWKVAIKNDPRTYASWASMKSRCLRTTDKFYKDYGGRGITICERWINNYDAFYEDMGPRPPYTMLERIDNNQGYDPFNCVWATIQEQCRNRRNNRILTHEGKDLILTDCAKKIGVSVQVLHYRVKQGLPLDQKLRGAAQHGTSSKYQAGCRCEACKNAENTYRRKKYAERKARRK